MCGIAGLFERDGAFKDSPSQMEARVRACVDEIAHRGPDAAAARAWPSLGLCLGHRRLSILDLSERSNQPMGLPDGSAWLSYNGEIYNFRAIKAELESAGERFSTTSDTEVLLVGYRRWGLEELLRRCAGMFAFALYDAKSRTLHLARDRAGKKPLYWFDHGGLVGFCSELRGLLKLSPRKPQLSPEGLRAYLTLKFAPSPGSLLEGVRKVPPAGFVSISASGASTTRYWTPLGAASVRSGLEERIVRALTTAAERRLVADVPVSVFLSGGVDSTLVVDRLCAGGARGTATYTIGYEDLPGYSEFEYSRLTAKKYPIDYREVVIGSGQALEALTDESLVLDDPVADWAWVPLHFISRAARKDGFKVVLLGEGSDELFFGYDVMMKGLKLLERYDNTAWRTAAKAGYALAAPVYAATSRGHRRFDVWRRAAKGLPLYWGSSIGFPATQLAQLAGPELDIWGEDLAQAHVAGLHARFAQEAADPTDRVNLISFVEFYTKMSETLLHRVDRVTMLHSLEARAPFLDHELCELAFSIPGEKKIPERRLKGLLKDVARKLIPPEIVDRPKMGFSFPFKEWLRGPLGPAVESAFESSKLFAHGWLDAKLPKAMLAEHRRGRADHAPRLWQLYSLARWYDRWVA